MEILSLLVEVCIGQHILRPVTGPLSSFCASPSPSVTPGLSSSAVSWGRGTSELLKAFMSLLMLKASFFFLSEYHFVSLVQTFRVLLRHLRQKFVAKMSAIDYFPVIKYCVV